MNNFRITKQLSSIILISPLFFGGFWACSEDVTGGDNGGIPKEVGEFAIHVDRSTYSFGPSVFGERVFWADSEFDSQRDNVYGKLISGSEISQYTNFEAQQSAQEVYGNNLVWSDHRAHSASNQNIDIYLQELDTGTTYQVTTNIGGQYAVEIFEHIILWRDDRDASGSMAGDVYVYDMGPDKAFATADDRGEINITPNPYDQAMGDVWVSPLGRPTIVWHDLRNDADGACQAECNKDIYLYDFGADTIFGTSDDIGPIQMTSDTKEQTSPTIFGRWVVWLDARGGNAADPDIYYYDLGPDTIYGTSDDGGEHLLDIPTVEPSDPDIWGDRLVFDDYRMGSWEIFVYDFSAKTELQLTNENSGQFHARIWEDIVVWQDGRNNEGMEHNDDIYGYRLP
ncbi:hypothetical protein KAI87_00080 [Myxococcota bacterium]|nr:hypothetical protein [Myxococcota bacterium]